MSIDLQNSLKNREQIINNVREEMIGPSKIREHWIEFNPVGNVNLPSYEHQYYWKNGEKKEEILQFQSPTQRYVSGLLFPLGVQESETMSLESLVSDGTSVEDDTGSKKEDLFKNNNEEAPVEEDGDIELFPQKNDFMPSSMGITCCIEKNIKSICVEITGGTYDPQSILINTTNKNSTWWLRSSLKGELEFNVEDVFKNGSRAFDIPLYDSTHKTINRFKIQVQVVVREIGEKFILTVSLTNRSEKTINSESNTRREQLILFQATMELSTSNEQYFSTYPSRYDIATAEKILLESDFEELSTELLYRKNGNYAFGHGCSTHWEQGIEKVNKISTTFLPEYQATSMTPDIKIEKNGKTIDLKILMADLAGITNNNNPEKVLDPLINGYKDWIFQKKKELEFLPKHLKKVGQRHLTLCEESLQRMVRGVELLNDPQTLRAFQLANLAILLQQQNGKKKRNGVVVDNTIQFVEPINKNSNDMPSLSKKSNSWRAFQIAFILASMESFVDEKSETRDIVDLIWFPTGGGKTEAYLGTAAFQMLLRRLRDPKDAGVDVIMRYTLRLLTADQFQRSSRLICSLEYIRKNNIAPLGTEPFSIGIWVGASTTPNSNIGAKKQMQDLNRNPKSTNQFIVNNCPWCGAKMGYYEEKNNKKKKHYFGYKIDENNLVLHCPDQSCEFYNDLPIYIVDETIYKKRPTFLIGTVDKFVQLVWEPKARFLFGLDENGNRLINPPSLIVQDELHLISGPLGTLTGLFETLVEELCAKKVNGQLVKPKIIAATATIKQFEEQTKALFGRKKARLFPSPGLDSDDSFFARPAVDSATGKLMPGRKYVGVYTTTVRIMMSQVMTFSSILQGASEIKSSEKDPYWTLLAFYNTLRELGGGLTLTQMDIAQYSNAMAKRKGNRESLRYLNNVLELTSRKQSHEISKAIDDLKLEFDEDKRKKKTENSVIDICLASNIIEVGVDIERLSVMGIVGQPKMTAQYIQVSGRVGRKWWERPGLIFTLYSNTKSRDKSHFEHFREYHEKLYAQVEATSVTPFSDSSLDKGLEAVIVGFLRQSFDEELSILPSRDNINKNLERIKEFITRIIERAELIDPEQVPELKGRLKKILEKLLYVPYSTWEAKDERNGYMYVAGSMVSPTIKRESVSMINSLRTVDSECRGMITSLYNESPGRNEIDDELGFLN